ncbi:neuraminidase, partial [Thozetella sp. PMI_491]
GLIGSGTYPRATKLSDGSVLSCYTAFQDGNTLLKIAKSVNGGWDWTQVGTVAIAPTNTRDQDNCYIHQLPGGRILAAFRNHDRVSVKGAYTYYRITICYSDTGGATWNFLTQAATSATPGLGVWEPFMMDALDGSIMLYFSRETNTDGSDQDSILIRSYDGGSTWSAEQTITGAGMTARDGMLGVVRTGGSNLLAVFESLRPDTGITSVTSSDDGKTWGNRRTVYKSSVAGVQHSAPQVAIVNGKLVASFQINEDNLSRVDVKVVTSTNGGASWGEKTTV